MYAGIDEMPLCRFVDVLSEGRYESLYREKPKRRDIGFERDRFNRMYQDYTERLLGDDRAVYEDMKRYAVAMTRARILDACILVVANGTEDEAIKKILKSYGVRLTGDVVKDIDTIASMRDVAQRKSDEAKSKMDEKKGGDVRQDRAYFLSLLASMASHFKYNIPYSSVKVGEFCALYAQMKMEIKEIKKTRSHGRNNR